MLSEMFVEVSSTPNLSTEDIDKAKEVFNEYREKGVFIKGNFEDENWQMTDEYVVVGINFEFNEFRYRRFYEELFELSFEEFVDTVKIFVISMLGRYVPYTIKAFVNDIRRIIETNPDKIIDSNSQNFLFKIPICLEFLYAVSNDSGYELIEAMESSMAYDSSGQRALAEFDTYFLFSDILDDFWASDLSVETRLFYYPIYLWWHITAVIPLRPREFLLTARDCLTKKSKGYYLTVRRNKLKGRRERGVRYKISEDYDESRLKITPEIAHEIERYIELTSKYENTDINTLFVTDPHYRKWNKGKLITSRFYSLQNLYTCLKYFYKEVIEDMYHLKVVNKTDHIKDGEIGKINIGDTRHLSLINLMAEGGTPSLAMEMAGHDNIDMASHYYSNLTTLIECRTYRQYRKVFGGQVKYQMIPANFAPIKRDYEVLADGNYCYSIDYANGGIRDCLRVIGPNGELGYCRKCSYYRSKGEDYTNSEDIYKKRIEDDCEMLKGAISNLRQMKGYEEDIGEILLNLKTHSLSYSNYLKERGFNNEKEND